MCSQSKEPLHRVDKYDSKMVDRIITNEIKPFIFSNGLDSWPALKLWTPLFFKEKYGDLDFKVNPTLPDKVCPYFYNAKLYRTLMKLSHFVDLLSTDGKCYLAQEDMGIFKDLEKDYNFDELIPSYNHGQKVSVNLWIGADTRSGLHFDHYDNFLAQIYGTKKVNLISPDDTALLYPIASNFFKSPMNPMDPDFNKFPRFKRARIYEGELGVGDVLFIPKGWWHYIYSPGQSISLNCWYGPYSTSKELILAFYKSGWKSWVITMKDFIWHGILSRPFEVKLYSSPPIGKVIYELAKTKAQKAKHKHSKT